MMLAPCYEVEEPLAPPKNVSFTKRTVWELNQRSCDRYVGYRALWMKVIIRAAFDWVSYRDSNKLELRKIADSSYHWIFEPNRLFNSFENVCQLVGLAPSTIRSWVRTLTKEHVAKIEHLEREPNGTGPVTLMSAQHKLLKEKMDEMY